MLGSPHILYCLSGHNYLRDIHYRMMYMIIYNLRPRQILLYCMSIHCCGVDLSKVRILSFSLYSRNVSFIETSSSFRIFLTIWEMIMKAIIVIDNCVIVNSNRFIQRNITAIIFLWFISMYISTAPRSSRVTTQLQYTITSSKISNGYCRITVQSKHWINKRCSKGMK